MEKWDKFVQSVLTGTYKEQKQDSEKNVVDDKGATSTHKLTSKKGVKNE